MTSSDVANAVDAYAALKSAELAAEKVAQSLLLREFDTLSLSAIPRTPVQLSRDNLEAYRALVPMPDAVVKDLLVAFASFMPGGAGFELYPPGAGQL